MVAMVTLGSDAVVTNVYRNVTNPVTNIVYNDNMETNHNPQRHDIADPTCPIRTVKWGIDDKVTLKFRDGCPINTEETTFSFDAAGTPMMQLHTPGFTPKRYVIIEVDGDTELEPGKPVTGEVKGILS